MLGATHCCVLTHSLSQEHKDTHTSGGSGDSGVCEGLRGDIYQNGGRSPCIPSLVNSLPLSVCLAWQMCAAFRRGVWPIRVKWIPSVRAITVETLWSEGVMDHLSQRATKLFSAPPALMQGF